MTARVATGNPRLDTVLGGGLPRHAITLLIGRPGSGKTILAQQCAFATGTDDRPALYLSTVSEPLEKVVRFGEQLTFFDAAAVGGRVRYDDLGGVLAEQSLAGVLDRVRALLREHRPSLLVIDSFKALHPYASEGDFRRFLYELTGVVSAFPVTSLWLGEYDVEEVSFAPEFAVADAIVGLGEASADRRSRALHVRKLRGGSFRSGYHAYRLSRAGLQVFPRLASTADPGSEPGLEVGIEASADLAPSAIAAPPVEGGRWGVPALDEMLTDGHWPGATTLVAGPTGAGKTLLGLQYLLAGAELGEPGVVAALQDSPARLNRLVGVLGDRPEPPGLAVMYRSPVGLQLDEWGWELLATVERVGARRVLVDGLAELRAADAAAGRFREFAHALAGECSRRGVSLMITEALPELRGASRLPVEDGFPADHVLLLQYTDLSTATSRTVTVLKAGAGSVGPRVRELSISPAGVQLTGG